MKSRRRFRAGAAGLMLGMGVAAGMIPTSTGLAQQTSPDLNYFRQLSPKAAPDSRAVGRSLDEQRQSIAEQERKLQELARILEKQQELLFVQQQQIEAMQSQLRGEGPVITFPVDFNIPGLYRTPPGLFYVQQLPPQAPIPLPPEPDVAPAPLPPEPEGLAVPEAERPESEKPTDLLLLKAGGVLLPAGTLQVEPSIDYTRASTDRVAISGFTIFEAIVIGLIRVDDLERDIVTAALNLRYGVTDRIQVGGRVSAIYRQDREILGVGTADERERTISALGLGDSEASVSWHALFGEGWMPDTILRFRVRVPTGTDPFEIDRESIGPGGQSRLVEAPTGSGFFGAGPGATFVWRADPVVFFVGGGYTMNFEEEFEEFGTIDPGDTIDWFAGMNVALSEQVSLNLSFVDQITGATTQNGIESPGSATNDARLIIGTSVGLGQQMSLLVSAGAGLTEESPDFTFMVSLPISFSF